MQKLNKAQVEDIFKAEAILFGDEEGIPEGRAVEIFGGAAVDFARRMERADKYARYFGGYGNGPYTAHYMTLRGAYIAATYNNVAELEREAGE